MLEIDLTRIQDVAVRDAFNKLLELVRLEPLLNYKFKPYSMTFPGAVTNHHFLHGLGFKPKDAIITDVSNDQSAFFNMDLSTSTYVDVTCSGACTIRAVIGNLDVNSQA